MDLVRVVIDLGALLQLLLALQLMEAAYFGWDHPRFETSR